MNYMSINLGEKLKSLRKEKNISQEKLAQYLNVSFQAVSKWENSNTYPDISLLPEIARFFGITVDELLQVEQIDEHKLYEDYEHRAAELFRCGRYEESLQLWQEAYHRMPNNVEVKEMLMSSYFDADKVKYQKEIVELGTEIYHSDCGAYYKGQAISQLARTYFENGNKEMAQKWACKAYQLMHSREMLFMEITDDGEEMLSDFRFANYWYLHNLFYMATRLAGCESVPGGTAYVQSVNKSIASIYELIFRDDDMPFEGLRNFCILHELIAEDEISLGRDEGVIRHHLTRALECAVKSADVKEHELNHPLVMGWHVDDAPADNKQVLNMLKRELSQDCYSEYSSADWFADIVSRLERKLS